MRRHGKTDTSRRAVFGLTSLWHGLRPAGPAGRRPLLREHGAMKPFRFGTHVTPSNKRRRLPKAPASQARHGCRPELEALEDRFLPTATVISGFVYRDL